MSGRMWLVIGSALGGLAVLSGAFGAHFLPRLLEMSPQDSEFRIRADWFETAARYHMYHALALVALGLLAMWGERSAENEGIPAEASGQSMCDWISGIAFLLGILIFSGCLYTMAMTGERWLGRIVPIGGVSFVVGWFSLAVAGWRKK